MERKERSAFSRMKRELTRAGCPGILADEQGRVRFRNRAASLLLRRRRDLSAILKGAQNDRAALLFCPVDGGNAVIWVAPFTEGFRKVLFLRLTPEAPEGQKTEGTADMVPLELDAFLELEEGERGTLWLTPAGRQLANEILRALHFLFDQREVYVSLREGRDRPEIVFSFPDEVGITEEISRLLSTPRGAALIDAFSRCGDRCPEIGAARRGDQGEISIALPAGMALPAAFFQGRKKMRQVTS